MLLGLSGLLPLLYLPLRAGADVPGAGRELATLPGFLNHVLALGFRGDLFYFMQPAVLAERLRIMGNVLTFQFAPLLLLGAALGWLLLWRRDWKAALLLGASFAIHTLVTATYRAPQTVDADTVTGFGSFAPVHTSDGPPELRADRVLLPGLGFAWYAES